MSACSVQRAANNSPLIETLRLPAQVQVACPLSLRMCLRPMKTTYFADVAQAADDVFCYACFTPYFVTFFFFWLPIKLPLGLLLRISRSCRLPLTATTFASSR